MGLDGFYVHDLSAVAYVLAPKLFNVQQGLIRIVCEGPAMGMILCQTLDKAFPVDDWQGFKMIVGGKNNLQLFKLL
jgi:inosine-uridine nucleoside N-ribohydrolase